MAPSFFGGKMNFLGIDVSTTATKALLMDSHGRVLAVSSVTYPFETPRPLWSEQHPRLWWDGAQKAIRDVLEKSGVAPSAIGGIGLTGQMHGLVLLDTSGQVLRPAILWNDQRTQAECDWITETVGRDRFGTAQDRRLAHRRRDAATGKGECEKEGKHGQPSFRGQSTP